VGHPEEVEEIITVIIFTGLKGISDREIMMRVWEEISKLVQ
jgi:hypothetical protein